MGVSCSLGGTVVPTKDNTEKKQQEAELGPRSLLTPE